MFEAFQNIFKIPELKKRVLFSLAMLAVYRVGCHIPTPGIDSQALAHFFKQAQGTLLGLFDMFSGGALEKLDRFCTRHYAIYLLIDYFPASDGCRSCH